MMNMKKLIDDTDFDNLTELTKRWGNSTHKPTSLPTKENEKQNNSKMSNEIINVEPETKHQEHDNIASGLSKPTAPRKKQITPQVIDEDTQHFKNKLENLLNNFKTDAVTEFMGMKREMLDYQQDCVKSDTQKYLTMYEDKHRELLETKQKLLDASRQAQKKTQQVEKLSEHISKLNERMRVLKYVSRPFSVLYENKVRGKELKFKLKEAQIFDSRRLKRKSILGWVNQYRTEKAERQKQVNEQRIQREVSDIVGKFQKQMETLKQRLAEATRKNEQNENNKHVLQQNLKKAFLRGVCAMNMEALGVIGTENVEQSDLGSLQKQKAQLQRSMVGNNMSFIDPKMSMFTRDEAHNQSALISKSSASRVSNPQIISQKSESYIVNPPKAESKNMKWKEAPIMGTQEQRQDQEPRMQVVRPTTEGKVIKVIDGKSTSESRRIIPNQRLTQGSNRKK